MSDFDGLWAAAMAKPLDAAPRLVLSDWCEEHGDLPLALALRTNRLPLADLTCRYRRLDRRSKLVLDALRVFGESLSEKPMSLTYTNGGRYKARIVKWGLSESKEKKTPQVFWQVLILNEIDGQGAEFDCPSYERTIYRAITENTVDRLVDDIARLGVELSSFRQLDPADANAVSFDGVEVEVTCKHETYQGKDRERFDFAFGGTGPAPMDKGGVNKLDALFGGRLKPAAKKAPAANGTAKPATAKTPTEKEAEEVF